MSKEKIYLIISIFVGIFFLPIEPIVGWLIIVGAIGYWFFTRKDKKKEKNQDLKNKEESTGKDKIDWTKKPLKPKQIIFFIVIIVLFIFATVKVLDVPTSQSTPVVNQTKVNYQVIKSWQIPNGGEGKTILIPKEYLNEADMTALGKKLKSDVANDRNALVNVFTDRQAEALRDKVLADKATQAELELYDKNFVGKYVKNGNTGFHQFNIFFDGVTGTNNKAITY